MVAVARLGSGCCDRSEPSGAGSLGARRDEVIVSAREWSGMTPRRKADASQMPFYRCLIPKGSLLLNSVSASQ